MRFHRTVDKTLVFFHVKMLWKFEGIIPARNFFLHVGSAPILEFGKLGKTNMLTAN